MPTIAFPNPFMTVSYQKLKDRDLLDPNFVKKVDAMPRPRCSPILPSGAAPRCIGWTVDGFVTQAPVARLNGVSARSAAVLAEHGLETIGDMANTKSDFSGPGFSARVREVLRRVKAGVQRSRIVEAP